MLSPAIQRVVLAGNPATVNRGPAHAAEHVRGWDSPALAGRASGVGVFADERANEIDDAAAELGVLDAHERLVELDALRT